MLITPEDYLKLKTYIMQTPIKYEALKSIKGITPTIDNITNDEALYYGPDYQVALVKVTLPYNNELININLCSHSYDITYNNDLYVASGMLMALSAFQVDADAKESRNTIELIGLDKAINGALLNTDISGNEVTITNAFIKHTGETLLAVEMFNGTISSVAVKQGRASKTLSVGCTGYLRNLTTKIGNRPADALHKEKNPDDLFFEFASRQEGVEWELTK